MTGSRMFLFSGVFTPFWPKLRPESPLLVSGAPAEDAGPVPVTIRAIVADSPSADGWQALSGESSILMDALGRGFLPVRTHMGCLVADGDPVVRPGTQAVRPLVEAFVDLSRAGGRIPVFREASPSMAHLYQRMGFAVRRTGERARVDLMAAPNDAEESPLVRGSELAQAAGLSVEVLSEAQAIDLHRWLAVRSPGLDITSLHGCNVVALRQGRRVRAWARLWDGDAGGGVRLDRLRPAEDLPPGAAEALVTGAAEWAREQGAASLVLPPCLPSATMDRVRRSLSVRGEPRYTAAPPGWRMRLAGLLLRLRPLGVVLPV